MQSSLALCLHSKRGKEGGRGRGGGWGGRGSGVLRCLKPLSHIGMKRKKKIRENVVNFGMFYCIVHGEKCLFLSISVKTKIYIRETFSRNTKIIIATLPPQAVVSYVTKRIM